jgi:hypothetical protein
MFSGASDFRSKLSCCASALVKKTNIIDSDGVTPPAWAALLGELGGTRSQETDRASLQGTAPRQDQVRDSTNVGLPIVVLLALRAMCIQRGPPS